MHAAGAPSFGLDADGFIGPLPMSNVPAPDWPSFYVERRVLPFLRQAVDGGAVSAADAAAIERTCQRLPDLAGPPEPPARIHGDLWSGNLLCDTAGRPWLIDPAAHGGHRETDLAMLALFGGRSARFVAAYEEVFPLADGWQEREPLHQLHPLLVHAALFGGGYGRAAVGPAHQARRPVVVVAMGLDSTLKQLATEGRNFAALTTLGTDGHPSTHVMWVDADDDHVLVNTEVHRVKYRNVQRDPRVTITVWDAENPYRYAEVRGRVVGEVRGQEARDHIDKLAAKYMGVDSYPNPIQSERVILRISVDHLHRNNI
jgi:PPOX class probable F420-dependent enzyme